MNYARRQRRPRGGMSLMEVMVVIAILLAVTAVLVPSLRALFGLEQRQAAKDIVFLYERLHDESIMRNVTFRIAFNLTQNSYQVQMGEGRSLIFDDAEKLKEYQEIERRKIAAMSDEEKRAYAAKRKPFENVREAMKETYELPGGTVFGGVYTPQYGTMVEPEDPTDRDEEDGDQIVYSYVFPNGFSEHTVVWLVTDGDPTEGYTIEVEPLAGSIHLSSEVIDWTESFDFVPDEGPNLPN